MAYVGINVDPGQDKFVLPFLEGTKFGLTPLRGSSEWAEEHYGVRGSPTNFLIDKDGRIVFSNFTVHDAIEQRALELKIESLMARDARGTTTAQR